MYVCMYAHCTLQVGYSAEGVTDENDFTSALHYTHCNRETSTEMLTY